MGSTSAAETQGVVPFLLEWGRTVAAECHRLFVKRNGNRKEGPDDIEVATAALSVMCDVSGPTSGSAGLIDHIAAVQDVKGKTSLVTSKTTANEIIDKGDGYGAYLAGDRVGVAILNSELEAELRVDLDHARIMWGPEHAYGFLQSTQLDSGLNERRGPKKMNPLEALALAMVLILAILAIGLPLLFFYVGRTPGVSVPPEDGDNGEPLTPCGPDSVDTCDLPQLVELIEEICSDRPHLHS